MDTQVKQGDGFAIMAINGRLDAVSAPAAEAELNKTIDAGASRLVINLSNMDYISSAGLRLLLASLKKTNLQKGKIVLCGLRPSVREVFEISGLLSVFQVAEDETKAQALIKG